MRVRLKELRRARKRAEERHKITVASKKPQAASAVLKAAAKTKAS